MPRSCFVLIALLSMTLIGLELTWTRIFSSEFFYTFAFLILSLAVLGLGLGALALRLFPILNQEKRLPIMLSLTALFTLTGPPLIFILDLDFSRLFIDWLTVGKLFFSILLLSSAYLSGGVALAFLFRRHSREMPALYMSDLIGAGTGVMAAILIMNQVGTPQATFLISVPVILAAFWAGHRWQRLLPVLLFIAMLFLTGYADQLLQADRQEPAKVIHTHWDAMAKVKVYEATDSHQMLNIDNVARTSAYKFDGNWDKPDSLKLDFTINLSRLIAQFDSCSYVVIGAGGGGDVLQPLQANAAEIYAVEVIPHINELLYDGLLSDFTGYIYQDPRVRVITEDGRIFIRRYENAFDVIYSSSSNTFAALASGAFALAENYLFTTEAFYDYWNALSDSGYMVLEHQVYIPRIVSQVREALVRHGIKNPQAHVAVYNWPQARRNLLLLSKKPLKQQLIDHALTGDGDISDSPFQLLYPAADSLKNNLVNRIVLYGWKSARDSAKTDISPSTDDRPFIAQMGLWKNLDINKLEKIVPYSDLYGFPLSKMIIVIILLVILILVIPLNLIPFFRKGAKLKPLPWLYFFTIGMGFMIVEIILIQKYSLFIGPSVYSIATVLMTLLIASGIGSRVSKSIPVSIVFTMILLWLFIDILFFAEMTSALSRLSLLPRVLLTTLWLVPMGFFMGMPFPKGALRVGEWIDWGFAVNGAASVLGSTAIMLVAFSFGLNTALGVAALLYLLAWSFYTGEKAWKVGD